MSRGVQDEFQAKCEEAKQLLASCSGLKAEACDLKLQVEQEALSSKRQASKVKELQALLAEAEASLRRRGAAEEECDLLRQRLQQVEALSSQAAQQLEAAQEAREAAERALKQNESSHRWLQTEHDRLKAELSDANAERAKMRHVVEDVLQKKQDSEVVPGLKVGETTFLSLRRSGRERLRAWNRRWDRKVVKIDWLRSTRKPRSWGRR